MKSIILYGHNGSENHGCEAIVRGTEKIINNKMEKKITLLSDNVKSDIEYMLNNIVEVKAVKKNEVKKNSYKYYLNAVKYKILGNKLAFEEDINSNFKGHFKDDSIAISIGGDNYCYDKPRWLFYLNKMAKQKNNMTVLWGCSIEPKSIDSEMVEDLKRYDLITPRESITYNALLKNGVNKNTKLYPDPAFQLEKVELPLPDGFIDGNTIGINLSPPIIKCEKVEGATFSNFENLIRHILKTTDSSIALIPHVTIRNNNDAKPLGELYNKFKESGRVILLGSNYNALEIKGFIARCKMFIGARTHATIAAYSTCVPTLVVGYSVKALGIARDIFISEENLVIPVQKLENSDDLISAFEYIRKNENELRAHLNKFIPNYKAKALEAGIEIEKLLKQ